MRLVVPASAVAEAGSYGPNASVAGVLIRQALSTVAVTWKLVVALAACADGASASKAPTGSTVRARVRRRGRSRWRIGRDLSSVDWKPRNDSENPPTGFSSGRPLSNQSLPDGT
ncbi:hypothetical protein FQZ97_1189230 [compost metagenome]